MGKLVAGSYKARAVSADMITSSKKNTPGVTVTLRVEDEGPFKGELTDWTGWLTDGTKARTAESLALMGFDGTDLTTVTRNEVVIVVEDEEWTTEKGEKRTTPRVRWINDPSRGGAKFAAMDPAQKQSMLSELRGLVLAQKQSKPGDPMEFPPKPKF